MTTKYKSLIFIVIAAIAGGSVPVAAKYALEAFEPFTVVFLRFFFATLILLPLILKQKLFNKAELKTLMPIALVGSLNPIILFIALKFTAASFSPLIYAISPALTALYMYLEFGHKLSTRKLTGVILGTIGVVIIVILPLFNKDNLNVTIEGNLLIVLAAVAFVAYGIMSKTKQKELNITPLSLTFYFAVVTLIMSIPFAIYELSTTGLKTELEPIHILSGVYIGIIGTGLFYIAYQYVIKIGNAFTASLFTFLQPISGIGLAVILLGDKLTPEFIIGGILAISGAFLASR